MHILILRFHFFQVIFKTPVSITEHPKINEWLTLVEKEMRVTLAKLLAESVTEVEIFGKATSIDPNTYITWIDKYQVTQCRHGVAVGESRLISKTTLLDPVSRVFQAQLVVLSAQIAWSENVETALSGNGDAATLQSVLSNVEVTLNVLADSVLMEQPPLRRRKLEHLVSPMPDASPPRQTLCLQLEQLNPFWKIFYVHQ